LRVGKVEGIDDDEPILGQLDEAIDGEVDGFVVGIQVGSLEG